MRKEASRGPSRPDGRAAGRALRRVDRWRRAPRSRVRRSDVKRLSGGGRRARCRWWSASTRARRRLLGQRDMTDADGVLRVTPRTWMGPARRRRDAGPWRVASRHRRDLPGRSPRQGRNRRRLRRWSVRPVSSRPEMRLQLRLPVRSRLQRVEGAPVTGPRTVFTSSPVRAASWHTETRRARTRPSACRTCDPPRKVGLGRT